MTLMDAQQFDEARARGRRNRIIFAIIAAILLAWVAYHLRDYPERRAASHFFSALKHQNIEGAYGVWFRDPQWKQHSAKYSNYTYSDFYQDWGPVSEWGPIRSYAIDCSYATGNGVIVQATVNHRAQHTYVWVDKSDKTLHFPPPDVSIDCGNWWGWVTE
jgi:hypothetical protein